MLSVAVGEKGTTLLVKGEEIVLVRNGQMDLRVAAREATCPWLLVAADVQPAMSVALDMRRWKLVASIRRPVDAHDNVLLYRRAAAQ